MRYGGIAGSVTGASNRMFTATGLIPRTSYTFEVAAVSNSGIGPYSIVNTRTSVPLGKLYYSLFNNCYIFKVNLTSNLHSNFALIFSIQLLAYSSTVYGFLTTAL